METTFCVSVIVILVAGVIVVVAKSKTRNRKCPQCEAMIPASASVCANCGRDVKHGLVQTKESPETETSLASDRIAKLKMMGDADALAGLIADEPDPMVCRKAAEALVELGDERGTKYLENLPSIEPDE